MKNISFLFMLILLASTARAHIVTQTVEYKDGETTLEGFMAFDPHFSGKRPVVIVVHEWTGINDYIKKRCEQLVRLGYIAFAADIYGKGIRPQNPAEASKEADKYKKDRSLMQRRILAAVNEVKKMENSDPGKVAAIGYCFGGTTVLELARSGAEVAGVVSFHGGLDRASQKNATGAIKSKVLVCHGAVDPFVSEEHIEDFVKEMNTAKADYQFIAYSNAVHSFTNPSSGNDPSKGAAYNKEADMRSWEHMKLFLREAFGQ